MRIERCNQTVSAGGDSMRTSYKGIYNTYVKRGLDCAFAIVLIIVLFPVCVIVSIAILAEDGSPILYRAERGGYHGKTFRIYKFRSMVKHADRIGSGTTAMHDSRITRVGSIIRKLKIDEFPNILNIVKGDMSFIGPRPELLRYTRRYSGNEMLILEVRPGITDYSSVEFINLDEIVGSEHVEHKYERYVLPIKNKLRIQYVDTVSFSTDIKLFFLTVWKVIEKGFDFVVKKQHR